MCDKQARIAGGDLIKIKSDDNFDSTAVRIDALTGMGTPVDDYGSGLFVHLDGEEPEVEEREMPTHEDT